MPTPLLYQLGKERKPREFSEDFLGAFLTVLSRSRSFVMMVLDHLIAFSLPCNVLQFVETSLRVLSKTVECYSNGVSDEVSIVGNLYTISGLNDELQDIIPDPSGGI